MKVPYLKKKLELKTCHNIEWEDNYSWIHQKNILEVLKDKTKLDSEVKDYLDEENSYAEHHLKEFNIVRHLLHKGSVVLIDDTPLSPEWLDDGKCNKMYNTFKAQFNPDLNGKGSLVNKELEKMGATKVLHQYQTLWVL